MTNLGAVISKYIICKKLNSYGKEPCTFFKQTINNKIKSKDYFILQYMSDLSEVVKPNLIVNVKNPNKGTNNLAPKFVNAALLGKVYISTCVICMRKFRKTELINSFLWAIGFGGTLLFSIIKYINSKEEGWFFLITISAVGFIGTPVVIYSSFKNIMQKQFKYNCEKLGYSKHSFLKRKGEFFVQNKSKLDEDLFDMDNF